MAGQDNTLTVSQMARRLQVTDATVRNWVRRYHEFLSPYAAPAPGQTRRFTSKDIATLAWVRASYASGMTHDDILAALPDAKITEAEIVPENRPTFDDSAMSGIKPPESVLSSSLARNLGSDLAMLIETRQDATQEALSGIDRRLARVESQRWGVIMLAAGVTIGIVVMLAALVIVRMLGG